MQIKMGLAVLTAVALSAVMAASASASGSFLASKGEKLLAEKVFTQLFKTNAGNVECTKVNILAGTTSTTETKEQLVLADYEGCNAFGFVEATISPAHYMFFANGTVSVLKLIKIFSPAIGCEVSVPAQTTNMVAYATKGNNISIEPLVTGIKYTQNANCLGGAGTFTNGTYTGNLEVMIPSGTVSFMTTPLAGWSVGEAGGRPVWLINGAELKAGEKRTATSTKSFSFFILAEIEGLLILCGQDSASVEFIGGQPGTDKGTMTFKNCMVRTPETCTTPEAGFTLTSTTELANVEGKFVDKFSGNAGDKIRVEGAACPAVGVYALTGTFTGEVEGEAIRFGKVPDEELKVIRKNLAETEVIAEYPAKLDGSVMELSL